MVRGNVILHISYATCPSHQHQGDFRVGNSHAHAVPEGTLSHYLPATFLQLELHSLAGTELWPFLECHSSKTDIICLSSKFIYSKAYFHLGLNLKHRPRILSFAFLWTINSQCPSCVKPRSHLWGKIVTRIKVYPSLTHNLLFTMDRCPQTIQRIRGGLAGWKSGQWVVPMGYRHIFHCHFTFL